MNDLKLPLDCFDDTGTKHTKELTVKVNKACLADPRNNTMYGHTPPRIYTMSFSLRVPDNIWNALAGQTVPVRGMGSNNELKRYGTDKTFPKTLNAESIHTLTKQYDVLVKDYEWLQQVAKAKLSKVIFFEFRTSAETWTDSYDGKNVGLENLLEFKYAVGFIAQMEKAGKSTQLRYNADKRLMGNGYRSNPLTDKKYVTWTEEREHFFNTLQTSFENFLERIKDFESNLDDDKINALIASNTLLLGS